jgi:phage terminase large subunit GpA-like protein
MRKVNQEISKLLRVYFARRPDVPPSEWVQKHIRLTSRQSEQPGLYSLTLTPYLREIFDQAVNPKVRQVSLMKSAQIGYSQFVSNLCFYYICNRSNPIAIIFPSQALSQQWSEKNLHGGMESCEPLQEFMTGDIDDLKRTDLTFTSCNLKVIGGGSATKLSSNNVCYLFLDEVDKYGDFTTESSVVELAIARTYSYQKSKKAKIIMGSTPTIAEASEIDKHYHEGSQSKFLVPCPHCHKKQELTFSKETVIFDRCRDEDGEWDLDRIAKETYYRCIHCKGAITEGQKPKMLNEGGWVETNPKAPQDLKSYHISTLYSMTRSWGDIARQFVAAKNDRERLQHFYNSTLGLPWTPESATVSDEAIDQLAHQSPEYYKGEVPGKAKALVVGVDVQGNELYYLVTAIMEEGKTAVVDWGQVVSFDDLTVLLGKSYNVRGTKESLQIYGGFIDAAGNRTSEVYRYTAKSNGFLIPTFGRTAAHKMFAPVRRNDTPFDGGYITIVSINDQIFSNNLLLTHLNPKNAECIWLPKNVDDYLKYQLTAVSLVEKKDAKGFLTRELQSKRNNHWFDCLKMCNAYHYCVRLELEEKQAEEETPEETKLPQPVEAQRVSQDFQVVEQGW